MSDKFNNKSEEKDEFDSVDEYEAFMTGVKLFLKNKIPWVVLIIMELNCVWVGYNEKENVDRYIFYGIIFLSVFVFFCVHLWTLRTRRTEKKIREGKR